jgi:hypothetical protein
MLNGRFPSSFWLAQATGLRRGSEHGILEEEHHFSALVNGRHLTEHEAPLGPGWAMRIANRAGMREASGRVEVDS